MARRPPRQRGYIICRETGAEPEYFRGELFGVDQAWTTDTKQAYQFLTRRAAVSIVVCTFPLHESAVRVVPVYVDPEIP